MTFAAHGNLEVNSPATIRRPKYGLKREGSSAAVRGSAQAFDSIERVTILHSESALIGAVTFGFARLSVMVTSASGSLFQRLVRIF